MPGGIHPPVEEVLSWPMRSSNPERRGWGLTVATIVIWAITMMIVTARLWARFIVQKKNGLDDILMMAAIVPLTGVAIAIAGAGRWWYFDRHVWDLTPDEAVVSRKVVMAIDALYVAATSLTKISILLFYRRMSSGTISPVFYLAVRVCIVFVIGYAIAFEVVLFLGCRPINAFWNQVHISWLATHVEGKDYHCFNEYADLFAATAISMVQDFIACFMPCILFWKLQIPVGQKVALAAVFLMGLFTCICAIIRLFFIYHIFNQTYDVTWVTYHSWMWTTVEAHLGVICASLPALRIYFVRYFDLSQIKVPLESWYGGSKSKAERDNFTTTRSKGLHSYFTETSKPDSLSQKSRRNSSFKYDVELGSIAVTKEWEVASFYRDCSPKDGHDINNRDRLSKLTNSAPSHRPFSDGSQRTLRTEKHLTAQNEHPQDDSAWLDDPSIPPSPGSEDLIRPASTTH